MVGADVAHLDLEDSVAGDDKERARMALGGHFVSRRTLPLAVRINALHTREGIRDVSFILDNEFIPQILILPKFSVHRDLELAHGLFVEAGHLDTQLFGVVETVRTLCELRGLDARPPGLDGLIFGAADFATEMGIELTQANLRFVRQEIALAARRFGVLAIDSPCFDVRGHTVLRHELRVARSLGFHGKIAIHPDQVPLISELMAPPVSQVERARRLLAAQAEVARNGKDATIIRHEGKIAGPPFVKYAEKLIASISDPKKEG